MIRKSPTLQAQIRALKKERDEKIAAVLTPEQKKQLEDAKAKAKENRRGRRRNPKAGRNNPGDSSG